MTAASRTIALLWAVGCTAPAPPPSHTATILSDVYTIDTVYKSMQGPQGWVRTAVRPNAPAELVWVTGYRAEVVAPDGVTPMSPDFMCHSNLSFDAESHGRRFGWTKRTSKRLFTVSQGQTSIAFPHGFGIPLMSDEELLVHTQALNHNYPDTTAQVRVRVTIDYVRQSDLGEAYVPLYMKSANALILLDGQDGYYGAAHGEPSTHGSGSQEGTAASGRVIHDPYGREFAGHWVVEPGRHEIKTLVTNWMRLSSDARVHFINVHVHPFAKSLALTDLTSGDTIFTSRMTGFDDKIGLRDVTTFDSREGLRVDAGHQYELTSIYDNTTAADQEAMAVMYLYLRDDEFHFPKDWQ